MKKETTKSSSNQKEKEERENLGENTNKFLKLKIKKNAAAN